MPHNLFKDVQCENIDVKNNQTITGNNTVTGNETVGGTLGVTGATTLTGALAANGGTTTTTITASGAVSFGLGQTKRIFTNPQTKDDVGTAGTLVEAFFIVPKKSKLIKFGIMSAASDVICSTTTSFELRTGKGTLVKSFVTGSLVLGTGDATGGAPVSATYLKRNKPYVACVGTDPGDSGSFYYFCDIQPVGA